MTVLKDFHLYFEIIRKVVSEHPSYTAKQIAESTAKTLYQQYISKSDKHLFQLVFRQNVNQNDLDHFLKKWDIEAGQSDKIALLAYMMKIHPELKFDSYTGPRLKGLLNYLRFQIEFLLW